MTVNEKVLVYNHGVVIVERDVFEGMLRSMSKKALMEMFCCDLKTDTLWKTYAKERLISQILIEYEA